MAVREVGNVAVAKAALELGQLGQGPLPLAILGGPDVKSGRGERWTDTGDTGRRLRPCRAKGRICGMEKRDGDGARVFGPGCAVEFGHLLAPEEADAVQARSAAVIEDASPPTRPLVDDPAPQARKLATCR